MLSESELEEALQAKKKRGELEEALDVRKRGDKEAAAWFLRFAFPFLLTARTSSGAPRQRLVPLPVLAYSQDRSLL